MFGYMSVRTELKLNFLLHVRSFHLNFQLKFLIFSMILNRIMHLSSIYNFISLDELKAISKPIYIHIIFTLIFPARNCHNFTSKP